MSAFEADLYITEMSRVVEKNNISAVAQRPSLIRYFVYKYLRTYVCVYKTIYSVTALLQEKVFVCSPTCFGKKRLSIEICVSLSIKKEYTKLSMHEYVSVYFVSIHTQVKEPRVFTVEGCR